MGQLSLRISILVLVLSSMTTLGCCQISEVSAQAEVEHECARGFVFVPFISKPKNTEITPKCYKFFNQKTTFENAINRCEKLGSTLATPKHPADAESLANYVLKNRPQTKRYWIGLSDRADEGVFRWEDDGTRLKKNFSYWTVTEPDSVENPEEGSRGETQDCVKVAIWIFGRKSAAHFYDTQCNKMESYVCERDPIRIIRPVYEIVENTTEDRTWPNGTLKFSKDEEVDFIAPKSQLHLSKNVSSEREANGSHQEGQHFPMKVIADYEALEESLEPLTPLLNASVKLRPEVSDLPSDRTEVVAPPVEKSRTNISRNRTKIKRPRERRTCSLQCHMNYIRAACPLKYFPQMKDTKVVLNNASCRPRRNRTHLIVHTKLDHCGTIVENVPKKNRVSFRNTIQVVTSGSGIVRNSKMAAALTELMVLDCRYPQRHSVTQQFQPADGKPPIYRTQGEGAQFSYVMLLYKTEKYDCPYAREDYPVKIPLSQRVFLEVTLDMPSERIELHPVTCFATPDANPFNSNNYVMMQDGCIEDETFVIEDNPSRKVSRFSVEAFRFVGYFRQVYIHCKLIVCRINSESSPDCPFACNPDSKYRRRRDAEGEALEQREITSHSGMIDIVDENEMKSKENEKEKKENEETEGKTKQNLQSEAEEEKKKAEPEPLSLESKDDGDGNSGGKGHPKYLTTCLLWVFASTFLQVQRR